MVEVAQPSASQPNANWECAHPLWTGAHPSHAPPTGEPLAQSGSHFVPQLSSASPPPGTSVTGGWPAYHAYANGHVPNWVPGPDRPSVVIHSPRGTYQVGREVGAGHFGAVFECAGPFDQRYALKVLRPTGRPIDKVREEWTSEVRRLMQLRHPNVVYIHDAFEWQGTFCVALEWCDHTLRDMLEQPLQEELAIELSRQMLAAVQYLHDWDLVHDDLHAGNVLIQQADRPIVKISDFGISAELRGAPKVRPEIVHHAIMAPELVAAGYTSKQSDLYQLGMIMYWMITGESPVPVGVPYEWLVWQISEGIPRQRAEWLGTPLGNVVAKMLRRRDAYRYTSAREVWQDLRDLPAWRARQLFRPR
jgi:serine/threonine-protein kinase